MLIHAPTVARITQRRLTRTFTVRATLYRLPVPLTAASQPQVPPDLRAALAAVTRHVDDYASQARLPRAA